VRSTAGPTARQTAPPLAVEVRVDQHAGAGDVAGVLASLLLARARRAVQTGGGEKADIAERSSAASCRGRNK
jgi:hypothetical protein